jgi:Arc/MetJ family transcription regulator
MNQMMYEMVYTWCQSRNLRMRTTVTLDEKLLKAASAAVGTNERSVVLREALQALIERDAARRLARLGGSDTKSSVSRRRRPAAATTGRRAAP